MTDTPVFHLPLVQAAQAQKHVTVNEALARLDGMVQLRLVSVEQAEPPLTIMDGLVYHVPAGATGAWAAHEGTLALAVNGGWTFVEPQVGWNGWIVDQNVQAVWAGTGWKGGALGTGPSGASSNFLVKEFDHAVVAGAENTTTISIAANSVVFAVSVRVVEDLTGSLASWEIGTASDSSQFGSGVGLEAGSYSHGLLSSPTTFYGATPIKVSALGGSFAGGMIRVAMHTYQIDLPGV
jgi:hypothetical protein